MKHLAEVLLQLALFICFYHKFLKTSLFKAYLNHFINLHQAYFNDFSMAFKNVCTSLETDFLKLRPD